MRWLSQGAGSGVDYRGSPIVLRAALSTLTKAIRVSTPTPFATRFTMRFTIHQRSKLSVLSPVVEVEIRRASFAQSEFAKANKAAPQARV